MQDHRIISLAETLKEGEITEKSLRLAKTIMDQIITEAIEIKARNRKLEAQLAEYERGKELVAGG